MKVYKFGGASVRNAEGVRNLRNIIDDEQNLFIIVSAMGKTTNALERVFEGCSGATAKNPLPRSHGCANITPRSSTTLARPDPSGTGRGVVRRTGSRRR